MSTSFDIVSNLININNTQFGLIEIKKKIKKNYFPGFYWKHIIEISLRGKHADVVNVFELWRKSLLTRSVLVIDVKTHLHCLCVVNELCIFVNIFFFIALFFVIHTNFWIYNYYIQEDWFLRISDVYKKKKNEFYVLLLSKKFCFFQI